MGDQLKNRLLIVDDSSSIHADFKKMLHFHIDYTAQGNEAITLIKNQGQYPYSIVFIEIHMPPKLEIFETIKKIWTLDPNIQIVMYTAYAGYPWGDIFKHIGESDNLILLKKPFDLVEIRQLVRTLSKKWQLSCQIKSLQPKSDVTTLPHHTLHNIQHTASHHPENIDTQLIHRLEIEKALRHALTKKDELFMVYQPIFDTNKKVVVAFEALIRWKHPEKGLIFPNEFIPVAEKSGLIGEIGEFTLEAACRQNKAWQDAGLPKVRVSVNLSCREFRKGGIDKKIEAVLKETQLEPQYLEIEMTEMSSADNPEFLLALMEKIKALGVSLSLDDFGTGYSSLNYIRKFPFTRLKIDKSFIQDASKNKESLELIKTIIAMGKNLEIATVAEGIETQEQCDQLKLSQCDEVQGYLCGKPLPAEECVQILQNPQFKF